ncbi:nitroreductase [Acidovorax delafieldii]|uniref:nitroreductase n=1 Tax=Acidovorax delafieldii TaxID=47920 RepID=UPI003ECCEDBD
MNRLAPPPPMAAETLQSAVDWAISSRRSVRAFLPTPVSHAELISILEVARYAASGMNIQPWQVHVVTGAAKQRLSARMRAAFDDPQQMSAMDEPYAYYPREWVEPYVGRRREVGYGLYGLLGIAKGDKQRMHEQHARNLQFFDAPVGLFITIDRLMERGSFIDCGMFMQSIMVAARARGLDTCPQAVFTTFHRLIAHELAITEDQTFVCGMSLGHADPSRPENALVSDRIPVTSFTRFHHAAPAQDSMP